MKNRDHSTLPSLTSLSLADRKKLLANELDTFTCCPYCMREAGDKLGCCGESRAHFEQCVEYDELVYTVEEFLAVGL